MPIYPSKNSTNSAPIPVAAPATPSIPLTAYLAEFARSKVLRKKTFFTPEHILFGDYMAASMRLYETCAVLGYTYREQIIPFVGMFSQAGKEKTVIESFTPLVASQLKHMGNEPKNFLELYFIPEATRLMRVLQNAGKIRYSDWTDFPKVANYKISPDSIWTVLQTLATQGIIFGYSQPKLAEKLFSYEEDTEKWNEARKYGLDIPAAPPPSETIQQRQAEARAVLRPYVLTARPDLLKTLGL